MPNKVVSVAMDEELWAALKAKGEAEGRKLSPFIVRVLTQAAKKWKKPA